MVVKSDVVISGVAGYFPKAGNLEEFKEQLFNNGNLFGSRWRKESYEFSNIIAPIRINKCDSSCFAMTPDYGNVIDPQHRVSFERAYEAILDAGVNPTEIRGEKVAVYAGICIADNEMVSKNVASSQSLMGMSTSLLPNRISYALKLTGPSLTILCNWLSGIHVLETACEVVGTNQCKAAIVVTTNLVLSEETSRMFNKLGLLSLDGITKPFSEHANGYGRSDGVIAFYIQRACDAKRCYSTILGVKGRFESPENAGFRDINSASMAEFMDSFYRDCKVNPVDVDFVECYGCGIKEYDEVELDAINNVYCKDRKKPLLVGSVKSNVGHAECSSVFMSVAKVLVAIESGVIPANLHYDPPNLNCKPLTEGKIVVVNKNKKCNLNLVAINAVGLTSSYGHILLKANPKKGNKQIDNIPRLINISARTPEGIIEIINLLKSEKELDSEYISLIHETLKTSIPNFLIRGYLLRCNNNEARYETKSLLRERPPLWFVYSGMGSHWLKMGANLMELPVFAETIYKCHEVLTPKGVDLLNILTGNDINVLKNILNCFVGIAAVQIALTNILNVLDITPDGIIGHSVGELGCAYADKCLTAEEMILCAYYRGKASLEADLIPGMMAAVGIGYKKLKPRCPSSIDIACHNSSDSCTISGPTEDVESFVEMLTREKEFAKLVNTGNIAYHSRYIKPAAPLLLQYLKEIIPNPHTRSSKWISTSIPEKRWYTKFAKTSSAEYYTNNLLSEVLFEESIMHIPEGAIVVEIAPHGLLQAILKRSLIKCVHIPLASRHSKDGLQFLLEALGKMYISGVEMNLSKIYPKIDYPVCKGTKSLVPLVKWNHNEDWPIYTDKKLNTLARTNVKNLQISSNDLQFKHLNGYRLHNFVIIPTSFYVETLHEILNSLMKKDQNINAVIEDLTFKNVLCVPKTGQVNVFMVITKGKGNLEIISNTRLVATGKIRILEEDTSTYIPSLMLDPSNNNKIGLNKTDIYNEFQHRRHHYSGSYRLIKNIKIFDNGSVATVRYNNQWPYLLESMLQQLLFCKGIPTQKSLIITGIQKIVLDISSLPNKADDVEVLYSFSTGVISAPGITLSGIKTELSEKYNIREVPNETSFTSLLELTNVQSQNLVDVIDFSLKYCIESFGDVCNYNPKITEIETKNPLLKNSIECILNKNSKLAITYSMEKNIKNLAILPGQPLIVIYNDNLNQDCIDFVISSNAFILSHNQSKLNNYGITEIANFQVANVRYSLIRKISSSIPKIVLVENNTETRDIALTISTIRSNTLLDEKNKVYLIFRRIPLKGILNQVKEIRQLPNAQNFRFVYILDKNAPDISEKNSFYTKIFEADLILSVVTKGSIYTCMSFSKDAGSISSQSFEFSSLVNNTNINYVGVNATQASSNDLKHPISEILDYSGVTNAGSAIMGLGWMDLKWGRFIPDPILTWDVPDFWTLKDAATVPCVYAMAYYSLGILGIERFVKHKTVLIHDACTPIGLATIRVACQYSNSIFATVNSETEKTIIMKMFYFMNDDNVFYTNDLTFEARILEATKGRGAEIILNCLSNHMLDATMRCIAPHGRFIHMRKRDIDENQQIHLLKFIKAGKLNVFFIEDLFSFHPDIKRQLHDLVANGIKNLTVIPLPQKVIQDTNLETALRKINCLHRENKMLLEITKNFSLNNLIQINDTQHLLKADSSYLICGGTSEMWLDAVEWLTFRGAKIIVVASEISNNNYINHRMHAYKVYYNAKIEFLPCKNNFETECLSLIINVNKTKPIGAVFILPKVDPEMVFHLDHLLQTITPNALLINFDEQVSGICEMRNYTDFAGYNIHWDVSNDTFSDALKDLDWMLKSKFREMVSNTKVTDLENVGTARDLCKKFNLLLPSFNIKTLKEEIQEITNEPDFVILPSLAAHTKAVPPTFIIPGIFQKSVVQILASNLLSVCYCAVFSSTPMTLKNMAAALVKKIRQIYPKGPYNIVGISYGGVLAVEVTRLLEEDNSKTLLCLLDGAPDTIRGVFELFGNGTNNEIGLLYHSLNIRDNQTLKDLYNISGWNQRIDRALAGFNCAKEDRATLRNILTTLKNYVDDIINYEIPGTLIGGTVCLLRPIDAYKNDVCGLLKFCAQDPQVYLIPGDHLTMLQEREAAIIININILL